MGESETKWALLAGLVVIGVGGLFTNVEKTAEQEVEKAEKMDSQITTTLAQVLANKTILEEWLAAPQAALDGNKGPLVMSQISPVECTVSTPNTAAADLALHQFFPKLNLRIGQATTLVESLRTLKGVGKTDNGMKAFRAAERYCVLELQRRGTEAPKHNDLDKIRDEISLNMTPERMGDVVRQAWEVAETILREGAIPESFTADTLLTWLAKTRAAQTVLSLAMARATAGAESPDFNSLAREELKGILEMHVAAEKVLVNYKPALSEAEWRYKFLIVEVWINWVLGLLCGGAIVLGVFSFLAKRGRVGWKGKLLGGGAIIFSLADVIYCYRDHPPGGGQPVRNAIWLGAYGGFWVGLVATLLMVLFPLLMRAVERRSVGGQGSETRIGAPAVGTTGAGTKHHPKG